MEELIYLWVNIFFFIILFQIFACRHKQLTVSHQANNREHAKRDREIQAVVIGKGTIQALRHTGRKVTCTAAARAAAAFLNDRGIKHDGINRFNDCLGHILRIANGLRHGAKATARLTAKDLDVTFTAKQHHTLIKHSNAVKLL